MSEAPERGEQVEARIARRLEAVYAWKVVDRHGWWGAYDPDWGWYDSSQAAKFTKFQAALAKSGVRFADREILNNAKVVGMSEALTLIVESVEATGNSSDRGAAIAKAATLLRYMHPRYVLVTDDPATGSVTAPPQDAMDAELVNAERRAAEKWADAERKRRAKEWQQTHGSLPPGAVRTWQDDDWREQE